MSNSTLYDSDFYGWAFQQASLLRSGAYAEADIANIVEELETMGRSERRELINRLAVLLTQLLKWDAQPALRGTGWRLTIREQRRQVARVLADNPSLRPQFGELLSDAFGDALLAAQRETGLLESAFPPMCPWPAEQVLRGDSPD